MSLDLALDEITGTHAGDSIALLFFAVLGIYFVQNFLACREPHCLITGPGFLLASILMGLRLSNLFDHGWGLPGFRMSRSVVELTTD